MPKSTFADRLERAMAKAQISQTKLAQSIGVTQGAVQQWCSRSTKAPKPENLFAAADVLGCSARWLATGRKE